jgi:hypothetical protein
MIESSKLMTPCDWAKCINPEGCWASLIPVIENSDLLAKSPEPITFLECIQRAKDMQRWLTKPSK